MLRVSALHLGEKVVMITRQIIFFAVIAVVLKFEVLKTTYNEHERLILLEMPRRQMNYIRIYAVDESLSTRNSVDTVFDYLDYSMRVEKFLLVFDLTRL